MPRQRSYSRVTAQALAMLGKLIRADRAGISRTTTSSVEKGGTRPTVATRALLPSMSPG